MENTKVPPISGTFLFRRSVKAQICVLKMSIKAHHLGRRCGSLKNLVFEGDAFRIVLFEPCFRGVPICEHLKVLGVALVNKASRCWRWTNVAPSSRAT
jgi:hypothetical protein